MARFRVVQEAGFGGSLTVATILLMVSASLATSLNGADVSLVRVSSETDSGASITSPSSARAGLAGAAQHSVDTTNSTLLQAFFGFLEPVAGASYGFRPRLVHITSETDSGASQESPAGARVDLVGCDEQCRDIVNFAGLRAFIGHLDPVDVQTPASPDAAFWVVY